MFTGLVEELGEVVSLERLQSGGVQLTLSAPRVAADAQLGDSVAVNGCCLTLAAKPDGLLRFDLLQETLARTSLGEVQTGGCVNLERALKAGGRLGGHFVQGHVDCTARIVALEPKGADLRLEVAIPGGGARYLVEKGSIAVDGISLTVAGVGADSFVVWIIPHTLECTNLGRLRVGDPVNLEYDLLAKYVERMLLHRLPREPG
jgi:riboflavin synthase